ncbi:MAG: hypothetical protein PHU12_04365 [Candidatus Aenigmarchaeota archaeon]|nr:hypothetical protein [Candidatus Aenigmarchaeota archaeon]
MCERTLCYREISDTRTDSSNITLSAVFSFGLGLGEREYSVSLKRDPVANNMYSVSVTTSDGKSPVEFASHLDEDTAKMLMHTENGITEAEFKRILNHNNLKPILQNLKSRIDNAKVPEHQKKLLICYMNGVFNRRSSENERYSQLDDLNSYLIVFGNSGELKVQKGILTSKMVTIKNIDELEASIKRHAWNEGV